MPMEGKRDAGHPACTYARQKRRGHLAHTSCRAIEVASLRVEQAKALGVPPKLDDLLIDDSWREALGGEFSKPYMRKLGDFLSTEWQKQSIYPPQPLIFRYPG